MHELSIATSIYEACRTALGRHGGGRLASVQVAVGELSAVEPDLLRYAWEALLASSPEGACPLVVEWRPARQRCPSCAEDKPRAAGSWLRQCPQCNGPLTIEGGDELEVVQLSYIPPGGGPEEAT